MISYMDFKGHCFKERVDKRTSYTRMFAITDHIVKEEVVNFFYVKHLDKDSEELHFITDKRIVIVKRHSGSGENSYFFYPLKIKSLRFRQNWQEHQHHRIDLELEEISLSYDSQSDCNEQWSSEYAYDIEDMAKTLLLV